MHDIEKETAALERLARAHKDWRDCRPAPPPSPPASPEETKAQIDEILRKMRNPEPQDVEIIRAAREDPTAIWSQLSVVGWRLYAKGGVGLLVTVCRRIELDQHPGFVYAVRRAWTGLGFSEDPRGV